MSKFSLLSSSSLIGNSISSKSISCSTISKLKSIFQIESNSWISIYLSWSINSLTGNIENIGLLLAYYAIFIALFKKSSQELI